MLCDFFLSKIAASLLFGGLRVLKPLVAYRSVRFGVCNLHVQDETKCTAL